MKSLRAFFIGYLVLCLSACAPAAPVQGTDPTKATTSPRATVTPSLVPPTEVIPVVESTVDTTVDVMEEGTPSSTPTPTLTEWEQVQKTVLSFRNRLERSSDGYQGLTFALEQTEPNADWCSGLNAAINDFSYVNDEESAQALRDLQEDQGCK